MGCFAECSSAFDSVWQLNEIEDFDSGVQWRKYLKLNLFYFLPSKIKFPFSFWYVQNISKMSQTVTVTGITTLNSTLVNKTDPQDINWRNPKIDNTSGLEQVITRIFKLTCISAFSVRSIVNNHLLTWVLNSVGWVRLGRVRECETNAVGVESLEKPEKQHSFSERERNQSLFNVWKGRRGLFALFKSNNRKTN